MGVQQAMQHAAARHKESAVVEAGGIFAAGDAYRAHIQYTDNTGSPNEIYGPRRCDERRGQADLERIRAAGAGKPTREMFSKLFWLSTNHFAFENMFSKLFLFRQKSILLR